MAIPEFAPVELRAGRKGLSAWVDGRYLGMATVNAEQVSISVLMRNLVPTPAIDELDRLAIRQWQTRFGTHNLATDYLNITERHCRLGAIRRKRMTEEHDGNHL